MTNRLHSQPLLGLPHLRVALIAGLLWGLLLNPIFTIPLWQVWMRTLSVATLAVLVFAFLQRWPKRLPQWLPRWTLQVVGVAFSIPLGAFNFYLLLAQLSAEPFWEDQMAFIGLMLLSVTGLLIGPWVAMAALIRQRDRAVREQAHQFERERMELERAASDARHSLLQAQVQPHFLFNTLANVRELVDSGSPRASGVLDSLIAYLRAAVPRLDQPNTTMGQELDLVRAYLELMQMRMPDRLQFSLHIDIDANALRCPPMTLMTLVENAIRHGIDPSEQCGSVDVHVRIDHGRCKAEVRDTGVGLATTSSGLGTGLSSLRQRLQLSFAGDASLRLTSIEPCGLLAELDFPAEPAP